ncbi:hypothetical protein RhiirA5_373738 [Rhizophagus irregularis]|uniref:Uncharacterized protein n=2 Tax=Rhizophagus irregularis TaxID=588596 RepID=U9UBZ1_RHIID|nr:hypothetical protein GLOIN_2v1788452 [Rhizophagus irregularis DAOM 181602=DAOM 197198]PKC11600.1 hypothetical protein RhiirA5_373738 [Rhizophagus irregularis]PKC64828.1 hypothetical protein RhiirA1_461876 [Rhizophagus irregularis]PKY15849.1 hypothetical protein RhiirB3_381271 [Rhizophagus irregularis]POG60002.1 hypothetical protein GLOIN_2v1788452 [Rhizophagus irregularis DAOM 181602=DAOM 197198]UZN99701.1 hypothetical protein OCT59_000968 [Rhizophagus irregularis]|eukprot:XP_025166868.1 hypothetical protein GLOIN_2v1788452 [Rhizophagus irregularis DAOM 181602=DAOM 197198]
MKFPDKFSDETKRVLNIWADIIQKRHQGIDEDYSDPLLVIEYNQQGLRDRQMTEQDIGNVVRGTAGYPNIPFPNLTHQPQSDAVFAFNQLQAMDDAIHQLFLNFSNYRTGKQDAPVGRVFVIEFRRANTFEVSERLGVFD